MSYTAGTGGDIVISITEIDATDTVGRLNRGIRSSIVSLSYDYVSSTENWHKLIAIGTNYCSVVDVTYNLNESEIGGVFITDDGTYFMQQIAFRMDTSGTILQAFSTDHGVGAAGDMMFYNVEWHGSAILFRMIYSGYINEFNQGGVGSKSYAKEAGYVTTLFWSAAGFEDGNCETETDITAAFDALFTYETGGFTIPSTTTVCGETINAHTWTGEAHDGTANKNYDFTRAYYLEGDNQCTRRLVRNVQTDVTYFIGDPVMTVDLSGD
jgi:hypothetical protein